MSGEGLGGGEAFVEDAAEGVDVAAAVEGFASDLFGGHVGGSAADTAGDVGVADDGVACVGVGVFGESGESEVEDFDDVVLSADGGEEDVGGFEVAVDHADGVGFFESVAELGHDVEGLFDGEWAEAFEACAERFSLEVLHDVVEVAVVCLAVVVDLDGVPMGKGCGDLDFVFEAGDGGSVGGGIGVDQFDSGWAFEETVFGFIDDPHGASSDFGDELVLAVFAELFDLTSDAVDDMRSKGGDGGEEDHEHRHNDMDIDVTGIGAMEGRIEVLLEGHGEAGHADDAEGDDGGPFPGVGDEDAVDGDHQRSDGGDLGSEGGDSVGEAKFGEMFCSGPEDVEEFRDGNEDDEEFECAETSERHLGVSTEDIECHGKSDGGDCARECGRTDQFTEEEEDGVGDEHRDEKDESGDDQTVSEELSRGFPETSRAAADRVASGGDAGFGEGAVVVVRQWETGKVVGGDVFEDDGGLEVGLRGHEVIVMSYEKRRKR